MRVRLTEDQRADALDAARAKHDSLTAHSQGTRFDMADPFCTDVIAYEAEIAASVALGVPWVATVYDNRADGDLVGKREVRHTTHAGGALLVRPEDKCGRPYILVTGADGLYDVHGWAYGGDVWRRGEWWYDAPYRPCWRIPQNSLRPLSELAKG